MDMKDRLTYMVVDDDPQAIDLLVTYARRIPQLELATTETHGLRALQYLGQHPVDLLLLDVDMPGMTGIEVAQALYPAPMIILVTAHREFAAQGFDLEVLDFLLKPPPFDRFARAIHKACRKAGVSAPGAPRVPDAANNYMFVLVQGEEPYYKRIDFDQLCYVESLRNEVKLVLHHGPPVTVRMELSTCLQKLPSADFIQIHRSYVVQFNWIEHVSKSFAWLTVQGKKISIGGKYRDAFTHIWKGVMK